MAEKKEFLFCGNPKLRLSICQNFLLLTLILLTCKLLLGLDFSFSKTKTKKKKQKRDKLENLKAIYEGGEMVLNAFKSGIFPLPPIKGTGRPS